MVRVLHAVDAAFARGGDSLVPPFSIELRPGERGALRMPTERAAAIGARMAAGIVKATGGTLFIGDFDPRIQPVQAKRAVGFVPWAGRFGEGPREPLFAPGPREVVDLHAALYEVPRDAARRSASAVLAAFDDAGDEALALALALIRPVALLVLDRPSAGLRARLAAVVPPGTAILETARASPVPTAAPPLAGLAR
jgi:hypothetical protein